MTNTAVPVHVPQPGTMVRLVFDMQARHAQQHAAAACRAGLELQRARLTLGWSLRQAAREAGLRSQVQVLRLEAGEWRPRYAQRLADVYARAIRRRPSYSLVPVPHD